MRRRVFGQGYLAECEKICREGKKKMKKYDFLIVGAGLYGAVMAHELGKQGKKCLVIDRREHIAGNIYCEDIEGIHVPRIFSIHLIKKYGIISISLQSLIITLILRLPYTRTSFTIFRLI